ncbi:MAG: DUF1648 domain-containing protein [Bacteroidota bacterium]
MSVSRLLLWSLTLALVVASVWAWGGLPEQIPTHFGPDGLPDRWSERSVWNWFVLPGIAVAMAVLMDGVAAWSLRHPDMQTLNLPSSKDLMALPIDRRMPILQRSASLMRWMGVGLLVAFGLFQMGAYAAAFGEPSQPWTLAGLFVCLIGSPVAVVWGLVAISSEITRQTRAVREAAAI